jgi:hypothetical protein
MAYGITSFRFSVGVFPLRHYDEYDSGVQPASCKIPFVTTMEAGGAYGLKVRFRASNKLFAVSDIRKVKRVFTESALFFLVSKKKRAAFFVHMRRLKIISLSLRTSLGSFVCI